MKHYSLVRCYRSVIVSIQYVTETQKYNLAMKSTVQNYYLKHVPLCSYFTGTLAITFIWQKAIEMDSGQVELKNNNTTWKGKAQRLKRLDDYAGLHRDRHQCVGSGRLSGALRCDEIDPMGSRLECLHLKYKYLGGN